MTAKQAFRTPSAATHHRGPADVANAAVRVPATTARRARPATMAGTDRVGEALGPAAVTGRPADTHQMSIVDHSADAGPTTDVVVANEHHPAQPATTGQGGCSQ